MVHPGAGQGSPHHREVEASGQGQGEIKSVRDAEGGRC